MQYPTILALILAPAASFGACPTAADLDGGIRILSLEHEVETFSRLDDGTVQVTSFYDPGNGYRYTLAKGLYMLTFEDIADGTAIPETAEVFAYPVPADDLPVPVPGGSWQGGVSVNGGDPAEEPQSYQFGEATTLTIGACTYDVIPVLARLGDSADGFLERYFYLPELGISFIASSGPLEGEMVYEAAYVQIEAVR